MQREVVDASKPHRERLPRRALARARRLAVGILSQWFVVVASPAAGRRRARVPKKMPTVTPRTAICAPNAPWAAIKATGMGATRYHGFSFMLGTPTSSGNSVQRGEATIR